jgi:hypothetical protein
MLVFLLRIIGTTSGLAILAVVLPYESMNTIHLWLGMGELPQAPIVGYLARTLSAFYALYGSLLWFLSFDTVRYRSVIRYVGYVTSGFGLILIGIDWVEGMPRYWKLAEGPIAIVYGILLLLSSKQAEE